MMTPVHPSNNVTEENLDNVLSYHKLNENGQHRAQHINAAAAALIRTMLTLTPNCADRSAAIREVRIAKMFALAAISLDPANCEAEG